MRCWIKRCPRAPLYKLCGVPSIFTIIIPPLTLFLSVLDIFLSLATLVRARLLLPAVLVAGIPTLTVGDLNQYQMPNINLLDPVLVAALNGFVVWARAHGANIQLPAPQVDSLAVLGFILVLIHAGGNALQRVNTLKTEFLNAQPPTGATPTPQPSQRRPHRPRDAALPRPAMLVARSAASSSTVARLALPRLGGRPGHARKPDRRTLNLLHDDGI